jgi:CMP-N,N'-diacetyllegionaminic acid synthase
MRVLIIGFGSIGKRHCGVLGKLDPSAEIHLVTRQAVADLTSYRALDDVPAIDAYDYYVIASDTARHWEQYLFLDARVRDKTILIEKPVFDLWHSVPVPANRVFTGYNLRFHPALQEARRHVNGKHVLLAVVNAGQYLPGWRPGTDYRRSYSASRRAGGGVLLDLSHEIDYTQWLLGDLTQVHAYNGKVSNLEIDSDDVMSAVGLTSSGTVVHITVDYISKKTIRQIVLHTEESTVCIDLVVNSVEVHAPGAEVRRHSFGALDRDLTYESMHRDILLGGGLTACSLDEGLSVLRTVGRIRESAGREWTVG